MHSLKSLRILKTSRKGHAVELKDLQNLRLSAVSSSQVLTSARKFHNNQCLLEVLYES